MIVYSESRGLNARIRWINERDTSDSAELLFENSRM